MAQIKVEKYYDVGCDICGKHLSSDFETGMCTTIDEARKIAKYKGFRLVEEYNVCQYCYNDYVHGLVILPFLKKGD